MESDSNKFILEKGSLNSGIYFLKILIVDDFFMQTKKLIIE